MRFFKCFPHYDIRIVVLLRHVYFMPTKLILIKKKKLIMFIIEEVYNSVYTVQHLSCFSWKAAFI